MPVIKNAAKRYNVIDSCLSSRQKRFWKIPELIEKMAEHDIIVEKRTIENDFEAMRYDETLGFNAPIEYCRRNMGYHYSDPNYSIDSIPLEEQDYKAMTFAINILQQYVGASVVKQFEEAIAKVLKVVNKVKGDKVKNSSRIIAFEKAPYYKGIEYLDCIYDAIRDQQALSIAYRKFGSEKESRHTFHPYFLKQFKDRWYVLGYSKERHFTLPLGLDRMESVAEAAVAFKQNKSIDYDTYFLHTIGITLGKGPAEEIKLWFSPVQAAYIKTRHIHHSQQTVSEGADGLVISLKLIPNYELMQEILSYGPEVKVIEPATLKEKIKEMLMKAVERYA